MTTSNKPRTPPGEEWQCAVVDHVERGDLVELLPHDKEDCVEEIYKLGEEIPPTKAENSA